MKSQPQRENSYKLNLFSTDTQMMTVLIQHNFLFVITYQSVINCLIVPYHNSIICFQSVKIIHRHVIAIYHQDFLFFEDSPVVAFLFLPLFFSTVSLERLSLRAAEFSVRSKHFNLNAPKGLAWASFESKNTSYYQWSHLSDVTFMTSIQRTPH